MQEISTTQFVPRRFPITVKMFNVMANEGAFAETDRVELIGGEIIDMPPIGSLHARCVAFLNRFLSRAGDEFIISVQSPIALADDSEPQPDLAILRFQTDFFKDALPGASDVKMLIEVADTTIDFDRYVKFPRYASAGIPEAWLVDLANDRVEIHSQPRETAYSLVKVYQRGEVAVSESIPDIEISVDDILG